MKQLYSPVLCVSHIQGVIAGNETVIAIRCLHMQWVTQQLFAVSICCSGLMMMEVIRHCSTFLAAVGVACT